VPSVLGGKYPLPSDRQGVSSVECLEVRGYLVMFHAALSTQLCTVICTHVHEQAFCFLLVKLSSFHKVFHLGIYLITEATFLSILAYVCRPCLWYFWFITNHFGGPEKATGLRRVCAFGQQLLKKTTFNPDTRHAGPSYFFCLGRVQMSNVCHQMWYWMNTELI